MVYDLRIETNSKHRRQCPAVTIVASLDSMPGVTTELDGTKSARKIRIERTGYAEQIPVLE